MLWKKSKPQPRGVPLDAIEMALKSTTLRANRDGDALVVRHEKLISRINVLPPDNPDPESDPISAVVVVKTILPDELSIVLNKPEFLSVINSMASVGAVTKDGDTYYIGSRLTIFEVEDAWSIHLPLILFSVIGGVDSILGATRRAFSGEEPTGGVSLWVEDDFALVQSHLSKMSFCNAGGLGLTAEFGLTPDSVSAAAGDSNTALWQLFADQPHPELGGGLFCLLELPHQVQDEGKLNDIVGQLNQLEMGAGDLPPHYGAWCCGKLGNQGVLRSIRRCNCPR